MKGFRSIVFFGLLLVALILLTEGFGAKKKESKKKEAENQNVDETIDPQYKKYERKSKFETSKKENTKKYTENLKENGKLERKKYKLKKDIKFTSEKSGEDINKETTPKITKTFQKVKKYKIVDEEPTQKFTNGKAKAMKAKQNTAKEETVDEVYKSVKKTPQKKSSQKDNIKRIIEDDLNGIDDEENDIYNEGIPTNNQKKRKYKLVEVVLEEDQEEDTEGNETIIEVGSEDEEISNVHRTEREEVIEKVKTTQTVKKPKTKRSTKFFEEEDADEDVKFTKCSHSSSGFSEDFYSDVENPASKYKSQETQSMCKPIPEDPEREGPKKLTLHVIEEEVDGRIRNRVVPEEDGVTMCEVAELLKKNYNAGFTQDSSDDERPSSKYQKQDSSNPCKPLPEDPDREGPKKLTFYVIEEEVDGRIKKRVVPEEDGVTMCEAADLLKNTYYAGLV